MASSVFMAKIYFNNNVDFYVEGKILSGLLLIVIRFQNGEVTVEREGATSESDIRKIML